MHVRNAKILLLVSLVQNKAYIMNISLYVRNIQKSGETRTKTLEIVVPQEPWSTKQLAMFVGSRFLEFGINVVAVLILIFAKNVRTKDVMIITGASAQLNQTEEN